MPRVQAAASSTPLLPAGDRTGFTIYNDSTAELKVNRNAAASATAFVVAIPSYGYFECPYADVAAPGEWYGIWASATGAANVTVID